RKKGMFICVEGQLTNSGEISMTARGAKAKGQDVYLLRNKDNSYEYVPSVGATGGAGVRAVSSTNSIKNTHGNKGNDGKDRQTGGGGSGMASATGYQEFVPSNIQKTATAVSGGGTTGTSYSGGTGGGSGNIRKGYSHTTGELTYGTNGSGGQANGGAGGSGSVNGVGNPPGGTGGLLIIYSNKLDNNNKINSNGVGIGNSGASGGGSVNVFYKELINEGTIEATGGNSGGLGNGGNGTVTIQDIDRPIDNPDVEGDDKYIQDETVVDYWPLKETLENKKANGHGSLYSNKQIIYDNEGAYLENNYLMANLSQNNTSEWTLTCQYMPVTNYVNGGWILGWVNKLDTAGSYFGLHYANNSLWLPNITQFGDKINLNKLKQDQYNTIVLVYDKTYINCYINGEYCGKGKGAEGNYETMSIGGCTANNVYTGGYYKNIVYYERMLTETEIQNLS
ncbi:MAG: hypothetical protein HFJ59_05080, partial [Clostridia bacterium]|nr:hypothetical protein [Clostridia bacterium]